MSTTLIVAACATLHTSGRRETGQVLPRSEGHFPPPRWGLREKHGARQATVEAGACARRRAGVAVEPGIMSKDPSLRGIFVKNLRRVAARGFLWRGWCGSAGRRNLGILRCRFEWYYHPLGSRLFQHKPARVGGVSQIGRSSIGCCSNPPPRSPKHDATRDRPGDECQLVTGGAASPRRATR